MPWFTVTAEVKAEVVIDIEAKSADEAEDIFEQKIGLNAELYDYDGGYDVEDDIVEGVHIRSTVPTADTAA